MADREFVFDGSPAWTPEHAERVLVVSGCIGDAADALVELDIAAAPVPAEWLGNRLSVLWTMFMASRTATDEDALTIWLAEHMRLLGDLPHDIVARAIDRAVQTARHGFLPSVGEIRAIADPIAMQRHEQRTRLAETLKLAIA